ncbi:hypothetical protein BO71DRAFT_189736 [Aspergillus ellipticus CBS 707.79]|uniref:Uncharacterized protein n=1 Tax=Aspergillus ellipticus CBS 707.79 TaxID=1448320 RepID=A0A319DFN6_9EURO|nr:hypothetical protein BO71DRAFT_189736 [Aspergillus ellipticus CBS 707.79]
MRSAASILGSQTKKMEQAGYFVTFVKSLYHLSLLTIVQYAMAMILICAKIARGSGWHVWTPHTQ